MADQPPKKARQPHFVFWYALIGFLFGILGIVLATFIALRDAQLAFTLANAVKVHFTNPLLWFFDLAPFVFAILLGFAGRGENRLVRERQSSALNVQKNSEKLTAEIYALKDQIRDLEKWSHSLDESLKSEKDSNLALQRSLADLQQSSKSTEDVIGRAKQHWETTFDSVEDMILLANTDGVILRCNKATAEAFKTDYTRMIGMPVSSLIGSEANSPDRILSPGQRKTNNRGIFTSSVISPSSGKLLIICSFRSSITNRCSRITRSPSLLSRWTTPWWNATRLSKSYSASHPGKFSGRT
jgi:PAS domain-containing protein